MFLSVVERRNCGGEQFISSDTGSFVSLLGLRQVLTHWFFIPSRKMPDFIFCWEGITCHKINYNPFAFTTTNVWWASFIIYWQVYLLLSGMNCVFMTLLVELCARHTKVMGLIFREYTHPWTQSALWVICMVWTSTVPHRTWTHNLWHGRRAC